MFTGIIEEIGQIANLRIEHSGRILSVKGEDVSRSLKIGESIAVDGACLTVTEIERNIFKAFLSEETLSRTTLGKARIGTRVNLERAVSFGDRMAGHLVTGHIDAIARIDKIRSLSGSLEVEIELPRDDLHLVVPKGSIAIDGISLTIASLKDNIIRIVIIPHTAKMTTLSIKRQAEKVNVEYDIIGKYMWRFYKTR